MNRVLPVSLLALALIIAAAPCLAAPAPSHPRPSGYAEPDAPIEPANIVFSAPSKNAGLIADLEAKFPKTSAPEFDVQRVELNGKPIGDYHIKNQGVLNKNGRVHGTEDFSVALYAAWQPGQTYRLVVSGAQAGGNDTVQVAVEGQAPADYPGAVSMG